MTFVEALLFFPLPALWEGGMSMFAAVVAVVVVAALFGEYLNPFTSPATKQKAVMMHAQLSHDELALKSIVHSSEFPANSIVPGDFLQMH